MSMLARSKVMGCRSSAVGRRSFVAAIAWLLVAVLVGCAGPSSSGAAPSAGGGASSTAAPSQAPKRVTIAMGGVPPGLSIALNSGTINTPGLAELVELVSPSLSTVTSDGVRVPLLAASVPSVEDGSWTVGADGTMQTTWRLRPGTTWHDGAPFTTDDLLFSTMVGRDPDLPEFGSRAYSAVDRVEAPDPLTVTVFWKTPYIDADQMFAAYGPAQALAMPLPRHILEPVYQNDKEHFVDNAYWTTEFVGTGPFQVRDFVAGTSLRLAAYPGYVLGRPKLDEIEVHFFLDTQTMVANVLAGAADMTLGRGLAVAQGLTLRDQWHDGTVTFGVIQSWIPIYAQFLDPTPAVVTNPQFRRALTYAMDRQQMADTVQGGLVPVADTVISPNEAAYHDIESSIVRYPYDPTRAAQLIEDLGYTRGPDGMFHDANGDPLSVEIRYATAVDTTRLLTQATADAWHQVGVDTQPLVIPPQRAQDREYRATFPAFEMVNQNGGADAAQFLLTSAGAPLPSNNYRAPAALENRSRYMNPEYDALVDRYATTIPLGPRYQALAQMVHFLTDQELIIGTVWGVQPQAVAKRITNTMVSKAQGLLITANSYLW